MAVVACIVAVVAVAALMSARWRASHRVVIHEGTPLSGSYVASAVESKESSATAMTGLIEVPDVVGMTVDEARALLAVGGLTVKALASPAGETTPGVVLDQDPDAGTVVTRETTVSVWYASSGATVAGSANDPDSPRRGRFVVCIDPGHQAKADLRPEPIGPGARQTAPRCASGARGVVTGQTEAEFALAIALAVKRELEAHGVEVVLTRTTDAVNISNAERARVANESGADLFVRIHAGADTNGDVRGVRTLYPAGNEWVTGIGERSRSAAMYVQRSVVDVSGARDLGVAARSDLAGFNWSTVPAILVECGFLTNPVEDKLLATPSYRADIARGIAAGALQYLEG